VPYALRHSIATILYKDDTRKDDDTAHQLGHNKSMKATYLNLDEDSLKARARKLWIKTKSLPPEEREKLQIEIQEHKKEIEKMQKDFQDFSEMVMKSMPKLQKT
jgi:predicted  nucleic acid-binding Zn-ribbon protein